MVYIQIMSQNLDFSSSFFVFSFCNLNSYEKLEFCTETKYLKVNKQIINK